jgi:UDP-N-acetylmuramate--alanine ligase
MKIHFVGISGIGISALAKYYLYSGSLVSGSDLAYPNDVFSKKEIKKIKFYLGHKESNLKDDVDLVIYSLAVSKENPELKKANKLKIPIKSYPEALGDLTKKYFTIAISGTHGKSTTTAMISQILVKAGFDPLVFIGSKVSGFGKNGDPSNFRYGKSNFLVIEADEYKEGFLNHHPNIIVITNIEEDHLDYYKNYTNILKAFKKFILNLKEKEGFKKTLIVNKKDKGIQKIIKSKKWLYDNNISFMFYNTKKENLNIKLKVPGEHNKENALAAIKVAEVLNIDKKICLKALKEFSGIWRRLEFKGFLNGAKIYDDYGHHPTEIKATLKASRELLEKNKKLYLVFQPHQYDRTYRLFNKFLKAFDDADFAIILDIYDVKGRENKNIKEKISSLKLVQKINRKNVIYLPDFNSCIEFLREKLKKGDICVIMGAGDVFKLTEKMISLGIIKTKK